MRVGIDEAGRGPVIGPMVTAAVAVSDPSDLPAGVADSKRLTAERRDAIAASIEDCDALDVGIATVSVDRIDDPRTDMNTLTVAAHADALETVCDALGGDPGIVGGDDSGDVTVLADACDTSESRFARRVGDACSVDLPIDARHGADDDDPVVAAASVVAKVERDRLVSELTDAHGPVGSGYPSDPTTREFLASYVREHGSLPDCARSSWQTAVDVLAAAEQSELEQF